MMALKNFTTTVAVENTVSEIHIALARHGARKIVFDYEEDGRIRAICFSISTPEGERGIRLPANAKRVQSVLHRQKADTKNRTRIDDSFEQAERVAWRIVKDWLTAQLAILETQMVDAEQVFFPYMLNRGGQTLYEAYKAEVFSLTEGEF